jgi:murein DD-endopeptidase MepM/ murein hydrolase activator NlpD
MVLGRRKWSLLLVSFAFLLPNCGDFKSVFNGRSGRPLPNSGHNKEHHRDVAKIQKDYFSWPLEGPINSPYGERHGHSHDGIDIGGDSGDPIIAAAAGEVVYSDSLGGYGNLIVIQHDNGLFTAYGHNKKNLVKPGDRVKKGQLIAKVGRTGNASGDHLHFEIRDQSGTFDPLDLLPRHQYAASK